MVENKLVRIINVADVHNYVGVFIYVFISAANYFKIRVK